MRVVKFHFSDDTSLIFRKSGARRVLSHTVLSKKKEDGNCEKKFVWNETVNPVYHLNLPLRLPVNIFFRDESRVNKY